MADARSQNGARPASSAEPAAIGVVTVSDRASAGIYADEGGAAVAAAPGDILTTPCRPCSRLVPDDQALIERVLVELADRHRCPLIVTTGGTGPAPRDVTPEATIAVCSRLLPGFGELMRAVSLQHGQLFVTWIGQRRTKHTQCEDRPRRPHDDCRSMEGHYTTAEIYLNAG